MALPVIAGVTRCTLNWTSTGGGPSTHNVLHFVLQSADKQDAADSIAGVIADTTDSLDALHNSYSLSSIDFIELDGVSGQVSIIPADQPTGGAIGDAIMQCAALISLSTGLRGPAHRGRIYLGPMGEAVQAYGQYINAAENTIVWKSIINDWGAGDAGELCVASYKNAEAVTVATAHVDPVVATQRRRLNSLR